MHKQLYIRHLKHFTMPTSMAQLPNLTERTTNDALRHIAEATHCQAGAVVGLSGALAAALAQAVANASLQDNISNTAKTAAKHMGRAMSKARVQFQALADQDADAITGFVALRQRGEALKGYKLLCAGPLEMADLAISASQHMQTYRAYVCPRTQDDLEFALTLMSNTARAAAQLLDSNLRIWPLPDLLKKYDPHVVRLFEELSALRPVVRIR